MAFPPSLGRIAEFDAIREIALHGSVIDLGGGKDSGYRKIFRGEYTMISANLDGHETTDIHCDLEQPLPIADAMYDGVVLINTLEHIYRCHELIQESFRISKSGADIVVVVPFLFPVHPSPRDYWRFTEDTLAKMLTETGYTEVRVTPLCTGVFVNRFILLERLMPKPIRIAMFYIGAPLARLADILFESLSKVLGKKYMPSSYPGAYSAVAKKA